jgi:hypothetical protein
VLGTTKKIHNGSCDTFYRELQVYVDSKEKLTGAEDEKKKKEPRKMEYWPLIKVVKIYLQAAALQTGAVIVDLPGVHDSNAARSAVAEGYMKQCTGLWIVAPINRAVDDKAAKNLLGDTFKRQLKYDGTYSAVTFICSKTDDISITEAIDSLGLDEKVAPLQKQLDDAVDSIDELQNDIEKLSDAKQAYQANIDGHDEMIEEWEELSSKLKDGEVVYAPKDSRKRKKSSPNSAPRKKRRTDYDSDDDFRDDDNESVASVSDNKSEVEVGEPLTEEQIDEKLEKLKSEKKNFRKEKSNIDARLKLLREQIREIKASNKSVKSVINGLCISGRNNYSKGAIRQDFAAGIRELDQENAIEEDEENFNPDEEIRDYDEVARSLPVFCVSSRAYQKLSGRLKKDSAVPGFNNLEETEIPQLQEHSRKLTEAGRVASCRLFFNNLSQVLNSLAIWASNDGANQTLSANQKQSEEAFLHKCLRELEKALDNAVRDSTKEMKQTLSTHVFEKYHEAVKAAEAQALSTAQGWGAHRAEGGLHWGTYKATVRRSGVYCGAAGARDFNQELVEPMTKLIASGWEKAFQRRLPQVLDEYTKTSKKLLNEFHKKVEARASERGVGIAGISMLSNQIKTYEKLFADIKTQMATIMTEHQREANREFTPAITQAMEYAYTVCTEEQGTGSFKRMKDAMAEHVETQKTRMFNDATASVKTRLNDMCKAVQSACDEISFAVFQSVERDYKQVVCGVNMTSTMTKAERMMKLEFQQYVWKADDYFKAIVSGEELAEETNNDNYVADHAMDTDTLHQTNNTAGESMIHEEPPELPAAGTLTYPIKRETQSVAPEGILSSSNSQLVPASSSNCAKIPPSQSMSFDSLSFSKENLSP